MKGFSMNNSTVLPLSSTAGPAQLRRLLALDAATCLAMGLLMTAAAAPLGGLLGLPPSLLTGAGVVLLPCAALMAATAWARQPPPALVWLVIGGNALWVLASLLVLLLFAPTPLGIGFVLVQATVVAVLLALERRALGAQT
jgi:hypothetical protein